MGTRTVNDPFSGKDVQVSDRIIDRLRGKYACGPHLPNGNPEFGWRQFEAPPIQHEAAARIEALETEIDAWWRWYEQLQADFAGVTDDLDANRLHDWNWLTNYRPSPADAKST